MDRSCTDGADGVLTNDIERRKDAVAPLLAEDLEQNLSSRVDAVRLDALFLLDLGLARDAGDAEEKLSDQGDG